ncbi:uncharacterized protein F4812DRAFT_143705 [Daldinia caldariorum]|uniref:uncharacterized protein n=1 Tax=Daldinia caldariorum TaxID=326644 RepID=UPI0020082A29|nr:uncharacterized protein F4812DRAFT_143705 [Daldinia caldariorum]KAI1464886.1 hypothetical protein F4812DRAFT_143705 [Daldinia caldariorum]
MLCDVTEDRFFFFFFCFSICPTTDAIFGRYRKRPRRIKVPNDKYRYIRRDAISTNTGVGHVRTPQMSITGSLALSAWILK